MKPAREFYEACVGAAGVAAASCVFVDDLEGECGGGPKGWPECDPVRRHHRR